MINVIYNVAFDVVILVYFMRCGVSLPVYYFVVIIENPNYILTLFHFCPRDLMPIYTLAVFHYPQRAADGES